MTDSKVNTLFFFIIGMVQIIDSSTVAHILSSNDGSIQVSTTALFIYSVLFNPFYVIHTPIRDVYKKVEGLFFYFPHLHCSGPSSFDLYFKNL